MPRTEDTPKLFSTFVSLNFDFNERVVTHLYYSTWNALSDMGGFGFMIYCILYFLTVVLIILYLADVVRLIMAKYKEQEKCYKVIELRRRLPFYKKFIMQ